MAVHVGASEREAAELALVLRAMGIGHELRAMSGGFALLVGRGDASRALDELRRYRAENPLPGRASAGPPARLASGVDAALGWAAGLVGMHLLATRAAWGHNWKAEGLADAAAMRAGEWWRAVTALMLHADVPHLAGNVLFGAVFLAALCPFTGTGVAALLCLLSGALGNLLNAALQEGSHRSLGASTAVFGALGALAALQFRHRVALRQRRLQRWTPLVMSVILLGYLGTEGVRTDIVAHVTGLLAGLGLGALPWMSVRGALERRSTQWLALAACFALAAGSWVLALSAN